MLKKWYISALVVVLTLIGVSQEKVLVPNQEIVLQFAHTQVSTNDTENAIASIKIRLQSIGVQNIQVQKEENGRLVIAYYSDADIANVKQIFSKEKTLGSDYASVKEHQKKPESPSNKNTNDYNLNVFEIQKGEDSGIGFGGKYVFELKHEYVRFYNPNVLLFAVALKANEHDSSIKVAYTISKNIAIAIDNPSYKIPEVRAGPYAIGNIQFS